MGTANERRRIMVSAFLSVLIAPVVSAQTWVPSVSNVFRYGTGERGASGMGNSFTYFENLTDIRMTPVRSLTIGGRLLFDAPPEVGERFEGLSRRYIEWRQPGYAVRAGNFSALFGSGLTFNTFENRGLAYDTWVDGLKGEISTGLFDVTGLAGTIRHRDSVTVTRYEDYSLGGASVNVRLFRGVELGASYVRAKGTIPQFVGVRNIEADLPGARLTVVAGSIRAFVGGASKRTKILEDGSIASGSGIYASVSYASDGFGITWDYKDYRFDIRDPFERVDEARPTRYLPFQNPPTVQREHSYALLSRQIHEVDFNDEVGMQLEAFASVDDATILTLNMSLASRHDAFRYDPMAFRFARERRNLNVLPSLDDRYSPYWELFAEVEHFTDEGISVRIGIARRVNVFANEFAGPTFDHIQRSTVLPLQVLVPLGSAYSLEIQSENAWSFDSYVPADDISYTQYLTLLLGHSPDLSLSMRYEHTDATSDPSGRTDWLVGEVGYTFLGKHAVTLSFGRERGGLVCSNGVCLYRLPFKGARFTLRNRL